MQKRITGIERDLQRIVLRQVVVRAMAVALLTILAVWLFYQAAINQQAGRLADIAQNQAVLINTIAEYARAHIAPSDSGRVRHSTLEQLRIAHANFPGIGRTGELTLGEQVDNEIHFLLRHRHGEMASPEPVAMDARLAEPMRRALQGRSDTIEGLDYRGEQVLAAFRPIPELGWGIVAKIDMAEVRAPYFQAGCIVVVLAVLIVSVGSFNALRSIQPIIAALTLSEARYRMLVENQTDLVISFSPDLKLTFVNDNYCRTFCQSREELLASSFIPLVHHEDQQKVRESLQSIFSPPYRTSHEERAMTVDGWRWYQWSAQALRDERGRVVEIIAVGRDITSRKAQEENVQWLANHDQLTALPNRLLFEERCEHALARAKRNNRRLAFLFIDLDKFKQINDNLGHLAGDDMLKLVARRLTDAARAEDTVARLGGDEFAILLEDFGDSASVDVVAEKMVKELTRPFETEGQSFVMGGSIGIAQYPEDGDNCVTLLEQADAAMYRAKQEGGSRYIFASG